MSAIPQTPYGGPVEYKFTGTSEPYVFSNVTVVGTTPEDGFDVTDSSQRITITYSEPVESVKCEYSSGGQMAVTGTFETIPNADKTIWTVIPGKTFWESSDTAWMFMFYAKDAEGRVVEGNTGKRRAATTGLRSPAIWRGPNLISSPQPDLWRSFTSSPQPILPE